MEDEVRSKPGFACALCGKLILGEGWDDARERMIDHQRGHDKPREPKGILEEETLG